MTRPTLIIALIAIFASANNVSGKQYQLESGSQMQEGHNQAPLSSDLNRTSAHLQPARASLSPSLRPREIVANPATTPTTANKRSSANLTKAKHEQIAASQLSSGRAVINNPQATGSASIASVRSRWRQMEHSLGESMSSVGATLKKRLDEVYDSIGQNERRVSPACKKSLSELIEGIKDQQLWASQMLDASGALAGLPSGLLEGTLTALGNFDECLAIGRRPAESTSGQYCSLLVKPPLIGRPRLHTVCRRMPSSLPAAGSVGVGSSNAVNGTLRLLSEQSHQFLYAGLRLGLCVPATCGRNDVEQILQIYLNKFELIGQVKHCQRATDRSRPANLKQNTTAKTINANPSLLGQSISENFDLLQQYILVSFVIIFTLIFFGTLLDDSHARPGPATAKDPSHSYVTQSLNVRVADLQKVSWLQHGQSRARDGSRRTKTSQVKSELDGGRLLGPQKNPLVSFAGGVSASSSPTSSDNDIERGSSADNHGTISASRDSYVRFEDPNRAAQLDAIKSVATNNIAEAPPIYDEIRLTEARKRPSLIREFFVCFSLKSNLRSIGKLTSSTSGARRPHSSGLSDIKVIHGLRTLSMIWIIFGHTVGLVSPEMMNNLFALANLSCTSRLLQAVLNTTLAVDTFFMISGLVTVMSFVRRCDSAIKILSKPSVSFAPTLTRAKSGKQCLENDYQVGQDGENADIYGPPRAGASYLVNPTPRETDQSGFDGLEVDATSVGSSSSVITSLSSSASSNRCIGSSSRKGFIANKAPSSACDGYASGRQLASGWPRDFKPFSWLLMRYLRLTPAYCAVIGLSILLPALGSGPFWPDTVALLGPACRANWWTNLLYVNNFIETSNLCLIHSWYLSNDWQFFLTALVLFGLAYKSRKLALLVLVGLFVGSSATTFIVSLENDYPPTIVTTSPAVAERWEFIHSLYYKPWPHLPSYLVGLLVGCVILRWQTAISRTAWQATRPDEWFELSPGGRFTCWLLSTSIALAVLNSIYPWNMGLQVDPILTGLHSATFRTLWAATNAWLVFALVTRPRNPLALMLSWHGFQITSRLTYCAYLVHPLVILYHFGTLRERIDSSIFGQLHRFMATVLMSYLLAFVVSICFESPFIRLQNFLAQAVARPQNKTQTKPAQEMGAQKTSAAQDRISGRRFRANFRGNASIFSTSGPSTRPGSFISENSSASTKRNQDRMRDQFIVRPADFTRGGGNEAAECDAFHGTPTRQHAHDAPIDDRDLRANPNHGAIDEEFQKKLAQAIGRGFKIRSKIVNSPVMQPVAGVQTRRNGQAKYVAELARDEVDAASLLALGALSQRRIRPMPNRTHKPVVARKTEPFSTFVSVPASGKANAGPAKPRE